MSNLTIKHSIVVPAYNEEKAIGVVLDALHAVIDDSYEIIVVDDGSADKTKEVAKTKTCRVISMTQNRGKGGAMRMGLKYARGENVIFIDADGTYPADMVPKIADQLKQADMVVAHRMTGENIHPFNRFGNWLFSKLIQKLYGSSVFDPLSGLYGIKKTHMERMGLRANGFEIETELTIKAAQMRLDVQQIEIPYHERIGESKLNPLKDGWHILKTIGMMMFFYNPTSVLTVPGLIIFSISFILVSVLARGPIIIHGVYLQYHANIFASLMALVGLQMMVFGVASQMYAVLYRFTKPNLTTRLFQKQRFVRFLFILGLISILVAIVLGAQIVLLWIKSGFSPIFELHKAIFTFFLLSFGLQLTFSVIFLSIFFGEIRRLEDETFSVEECQ